MRIGRYRIIIGGKYLWFQTYVPTVIKRFLFFWILEEVDVDSISREKKFDLGAMAYQGSGPNMREWRYCKAGKDIKAGELIER